MALPGFSVSELLEALKKFQDVWDAFFDEFDNAPSRIRELNDTIFLLDSALKVCAGLSQLQGVLLPLRLVNSYLYKLQECRRFIRKYESLTDKQNHGQSQLHDLLQRGRRGRDTIRYAFDGDAAKLKNDLMLEAQKLDLFVTLLQLGLLVPSEPRGTATIVHSTARPIVPSSPETLNASHAQRFLESNPDLRRSFVLAPSVAIDRTTSTSRGFLRGVGFGVSFQSRPKTESSIITPPEGDLSLRHATAGSSSAIPPDHQTPLPSVPTEPRHNQLHRSDNDTSAGTASNCSAIVIINSQSTPLQSYLISQSNSGPVLEWNGMDGNVSLLHYLGPDTFPLTIHSVQRESPYEVRFHYKHRVLLWKNGKLELDSNSSIKYRFVAEEPLKVKTEFEEFQGRLRDRELVGGRFECDEIRSRSSTLAKNQHLKIWKTRTNPPIYSLSFYDKSRSRTQYPHSEFPIRWFKKLCYKNDQKRTGHVVQLHFVNQLSPFEQPELERRKISWSRTSFTFSRSSSLGSSVASTGTSSPRDYGFAGLESTMASTMTSNTSRPTINHVEMYAPQDLICDLDYLDVKFSSATDMQNFKVVFTEAQISMDVAVRSAIGPIEHRG